MLKDKLDFDHPHNSLLAPPADSGRAVVARLAALKTMDVADLKKCWRKLFQSEPPAYNRKFLESRLAYRIQELTYGGLKPETVARLKELADEYYGTKKRRRVENGVNRRAILTP